jgi:hypothetical protein
LRRGALPAGRKLYKTKKDYVRIPDGDKEAEAEARKRGYKDIQEILGPYRAVDVTPTPEFITSDGSQNTTIIVDDSGKAEVPAGAVTIEPAPDIADAPEDLDADDLADAKDEPMSAAAPTAEDVQAEYELFGEAGTASPF